MKGIISNHSALTAYARQTAVEPVAAPKSPAGGQGAADGAPVGAARLSISAQGRDLAAGASSLDTSKIAALRSAIQSGALKFDSGLIAEKMLDQSE